MFELDNIYTRIVLSIFSRPKTKKKTKKYKVKYYCKISIQ